MELDNIEMLGREEVENRYLTRLSQTLLIKSIEYGSTSRMHPYGWNTKSQRVERSSATAHWAVWYFNLLMPILYFSFVFIRAIKTFQNENASPRETILAGFGVAFYLFPVLLQLTNLLFGDEVPGVINQGIRLLEDLTKHVPPLNDKPNQKYPNEVRIAEFLACGIFCGFQFVGLSMLIFNFLFPETKFLASSLHENPHDLQNPYRLLSVLFLVYISQNYIISGWTHVITTCTLLYPIAVVLGNLGQQPLTSKTITHYVCLQLWVAKFNRVYCQLLWPIGIIFLMVLSTLGIVGVIRYPGVIGLVVGNIALVAYNMLYFNLRFSAGIHVKSEETTERWKFHARGPYARQLRTLRPISLTVGSYFFVDMGFILTCTNLIIDNSITLLLVE